MIIPHNKATAEFLQKLSHHLAEGEKQIDDLNYKIQSLLIDGLSKNYHQIRELRGKVDELDWVAGLRQRFDRWTFDPSQGVILLLDEREKCAEGEYKELHVVQQVRDFNEYGTPENNNALINCEEMQRIVGGFINHGTWSEPRWQMHT